MIDQVLTVIVHFHVPPLSPAARSATCRTICRLLPLMPWPVFSVDVYAGGMALHGVCPRHGAQDAMVVPGRLLVGEVGVGEWPWESQVVPLGVIGGARN